MLDDCSFFYKKQKFMGANGSYSRKYKGRQILQNMQQAQVEGKVLQSERMMVLDELSGLGLSFENTEPPRMQHQGSILQLIQRRDSNCNKKEAVSVKNSLHYKPKKSMKRQGIGKLHTAVQRGIDTLQIQSQNEPNCLQTTPTKNQENKQYFESQKKIKAHIMRSKKLKQDEFNNQRSPRIQIQHEQQIYFPEITQQSTHRKELPKLHHDILTPVMSSRNETPPITISKFLHLKLAPEKRKQLKSSKQKVQRPPTKNTKLFNQIVNSFCVEDNNNTPLDNMEEDDFYQYVRTQK